MNMNTTKIYYNAIHAFKSLAPQVPSPTTEELEDLEKYKEYTKRYEAFFASMDDVTLRLFHTGRRIQQMNCQPELWKKA